ncbi:hypothetical protein N4G58_18660 [Edwardsiella piscicida]|nr:hypothetical protein N4G58_18660 [Edwardsiella piscicida]
MMAELNHWWPLLGIAMMRPLGIMLIMPLFNSAMLGGALIRNALALMAALPALPQLAALVLPSPLQAPLHYGGCCWGVSPGPAAGVFGGAAAVGLEHGGLYYRYHARRLYRRAV